MAGVGGRAPQPLGPPGPPAPPGLLLPTVCPASFLHSLRAEHGSQLCGHGAAADVPGLLGPAWETAVTAPCC